MIVGVQDIVLGSKMIRHTDDTGDPSDIKNTPTIS